MTRSAVSRDPSASTPEPNEPKAALSYEDTLLADAPGAIPAYSFTSDPTQIASRVSLQPYEAGDERITAEHVGRYSIEGEIGKGGIGRVLLALDSHLGRSVAIKELLVPGSGAVPSSAAGDGTTTRSPEQMRFVNEARVTGQLEHPGIVPVHELGRRADGTIYYTMRVVRGRTLRVALTNDDLRARLALLPHFVDLCHAIAYAHSRGVVHRDIKPDNVMLGDFGETVVLDWGLAKVHGQVDVQSEALVRELEKLRDTSPVETVAGLPIGTPSYMPPEQALGDLDEIDERSDVYSLGAVLYELLTGRAPFDGRTAMEIVRRVLRETPLQPDQLESECPRELAAVAMRALSKDRLDRYADASALAREVRTFLTGGLVGAHHYRPWELAARWIRRHRRALGSALFVVLVAAGTWLYRGYDLANTQARAQAEQEAQQRARVMEEALAIIDRARHGSADPNWFDTYTLKLVSLADRVARENLELLLIEALTDEAADVRKLAARSLGGLGSHRAVEPLAARLDKGAERDDSVSIEIINALGIVGDPVADAAVRAARRRAGQRSRLWEMTEASYRSLPLPPIPAEGLDANGWLDRGRALFEKDDAGGAADAFSQAIERAPDAPRAYNNRAIVREELGESAAALADYDRSLALDSNQPQVLNNRAALKSTMEDYAGALADYDAAMATGGASLALLRNRATVRRFQADGPGALAILDVALLRSPSDPRTLAMKGYTLMWLDRWTEALEPLDAALRVEPAYGYALLRRALVRARLGTEAAAIADLDRALEEDPSDDQARRVRASLRLAAGDAEGARADMSACVGGRCARASAKEAGRLAARAIIFHTALGNLAEALADLNLALDLARRPEERVEIALLGLGVALRLGDEPLEAAWLARLEPQHGPPWQDDLVALVHDRIGPEQLQPRATVPPRQCELALAMALRAELDAAPAMALAAYDEAASSPWLEELPCQLGRTAARLLRQLPGP